MRRRSRVTPLAAGVIGLIVVGIASYFVFGGRVFSSSPYVLKAMFTSETQLHIPSPVRIAGVEVGKVVSVQRLKGSTKAALVTMHIDPDGLPIHGDATLRIRPRIFLEGNFYADLQPGTPQAKVLPSGSTLASAQTSGPVQLDRVLNALTSNDRANLQTLLQGLGSSLNGRPTAAEDATQDPIVRGLTGGQALNLSLKYSTQAFRASAIVNEALLGVKPGDLSRVVTGNEQVFRGLAGSGRTLASFVSTFNATLGALAARQVALSQTIAALPPWLAATDSALGPLNASFPPTKRFARAFIPGVEQLGPTIRVGIPWLAQASALFSRPELGKLLSDLAPAVRSTSKALGTTKQLLITSDQLARCFNHNLVPTGNEVINDAPNGTGLPVYREALQGAVGLASASQNFDGNGRYIRSLAGGGSHRIQTSKLALGGPLFGNMVLPILGTRPAYPDKAPVIRGDVLCSRNAVPDLNRVQTGGSP
jgi:phospholipid/cholesterol/gamma-HCH transport system substrate-binding protein